MGPFICMVHYTKKNKEEKLCPVMEEALVFSDSKEKARERVKALYKEKGHLVSVIDVRRVKMIDDMPVHVLKVKHTYDGEYEDCGIFLSDKDMKEGKRRYLADRKKESFQADEFSFISCEKKITRYW